MKISLVTNKYIRGFAAIAIAVVASIVFVTESNMSGCPYAGPCHIWPIFLEAFIFVFISIIIGPSHRAFYILVFVLILIMGLMEPYRTGELGADFWLVLMYLPSMPLVHGGIGGAIIGYFSKTIFKRCNNNVT